MGRPRGCKAAGLSRGGEYQNMSATKSRLMQAGDVWRPYEAQSICEHARRGTMGHGINRRLNDLRVNRARKKRMKKGRALEVHQASWDRPGRRPRFSFGRALGGLARVQFETCTPSLTRAAEWPSLPSIPRIPCDDSRKPPQLDRRPFIPDRRHPGLSLTCRASRQNAKHSKRKWARPVSGTTRTRPSPSSRK
jgi:hypothetical protein